MAPNVDFSSSQLVGFPAASLAALRSALMRDTGGAYATFLQEAGYAGGNTVFAAFQEWLAARSIPDWESLEVEDFQALAGDFFREMGWGTLAITPLHDVVAMVDSFDWAEADVNGGMEYPCCHYTTGLFADFFGRTADAPLAVLEVECKSSGGSRCRFLVGSAEVMGQLYERMAAGVGYEEAAGELV